MQPGYRAGKTHRTVQTRHCCSAALSKLPSVLNPVLQKQLRSVAILVGLYLQQAGFIFVQLCVGSPPFPPIPARIAFDALIASCIASLQTELISAKLLHLLRRSAIW